MEIGSKLDIYKSMYHDGMHQEVLELAEVFVRPHLIACDQSW